MADTPISQLPSGTPNGSTSLLMASILNDGSYESKSVTPKNVVNSAIVELTGTLTAGQTSITFQAAEITANSNLEFFTDTFGVVPTNVQTVAGVVTLTFAAQSNNLGVKVRIL